MSILHEASKPNYKLTFCSCEHNITSARFWLAVAKAASAGSACMAAAAVDDDDGRGDDVTMTCGTCSWWWWLVWPTSSRLKKGCWSACDAVRRCDGSTTRSWEIWNYSRTETILTIITQEFPRCLLAARLNNKLFTNFFLPFSHYKWKFLILILTSRTMSLTDSLTSLIQWPQLTSLTKSLGESLTSFHSGDEKL